MNNKIIDESNETLEELLSDDIDVEENGDDDIIVQPSNFQVSSGEALSISEINKIAAKEKTKMIVMVGPVGCGKTTIEASLYQLFQDSPVDDIYFAGSKTIQGYEQRSYYTRVKSKKNIPTTQRTSQESNQSFLHLKLWSEKTELMHNFVFADLSGEAYEAIVGRVEEARKQFDFIDSADYIVSVLDGSLLSDKRRARSTVSDMLELLRTFLDAGMISEKCILQVVFSKYDLMYESEEMEKIIQNTQRTIDSNLKEIFNNIEYYNVAAMPDKTDIFSIGYGLQELLKSWFRNHKYISMIEKRFDMNDLSEYDKLQNKLMGVIE